MLFFLTGALILGVVSIRIQRNIATAYNRELFTLGQDTETLIIGDSHTATSLDPAVLTHAFNASRSRESYFYSYYKFRKLIQYNPQIRKVIVGFSYHNISRLFNESILHEPSSLELYYYLLDEDAIKHVTTSDHDYRVAYLKLWGIPVNIYDNPVQMKAFMGRKLQRSDFPFIEGYYPGKGSHVTIADAIGKVDRHYLDAKGRFSGTSLLMLEYLEKIIADCEDSGIKVYLFNGPLHAAYLGRIPQDAAYAFGNAKEAILEKHPSTTYLDYSRFPLEEDAYGDVDHVNVNGAMVISGDVKNLLGRQ
jgi:hypothetical protein